MERRKFLFGAGSTVIGASALVGSGAFSSVNAERSVDVETTADSSANLAFYANEEYEGDEGEYVTEDKIETIAFSFEDVNRNAVTKYEDLFVVKNNGTQSVQLRVANDPGEPGEDPIWGSGVGTDGPMDIKHPEGGSMVGGNFQQTRAEGSIELGPGEKLVLTVELDTREFGTDSWTDGTIYFEAA
ncbi:hypothetical protein [Natronolimnohabitans innermongolicus]|uniref:hypothetical protein n=1 Tax=Natronolimnohabitans innermongolicus TaxID=253107 RepID=UPI0012681B25|nr:hypothetical protein [Natronolimnohabitans innermongolicus]